jgi:hypothetical protein
MTESRSQFPGRTGANSDAQSFLVDVFYPPVGPRKTIPRVVDLLLGEILDYEEVLSGIVRLAQFAVGCNHVRAVDHETRLVRTRCRGVLRPGSRVDLGRAAGDMHRA